VSAQQASGHSPCIGICEIDEDSGYCRGCWRSIEEIVNWASSDQAQRSAVLAQLPSRRRDRAGQD